MTHDPLQTYAMLGAYSGVPTLQPFTGQQHYGQYGILNPLAQQQLLTLLGQTNPQLQGISPFHLGGGAGLFQGAQHNPFGFQQQNPFGGIQQFQQHNPFGGIQQNPLAALQNPWLALQNPLLAATLQNPLLAATLQNPMPHPLLTQGIGQSPYQQQGIGGGYGQAGYPLAPQSWIGQGAQTGQINPLLYQQLAARAFTPGIHPWTGF